MTDDYRLFRGGSWNPNAPIYHGASYRAYHDARIRTVMHGFRIAEDIGNDCVRVLRGGSWVDYSWFIRSVNRIGFEPDYRFTDQGFRVVEDL